MILVTGATGFVGTALLDELARREMDVRAAHRSNSFQAPNPVKQFKLQDLDSSTDWFRALEGIDTVIHAAARAHVMNDSVSDPLSEFRKVNTEGTMNLARQAATADVKRFIFISSIKVNGEMTAPGKPFTADDDPAPEDPYGISKWEAEVGLRRLAAESDLKVVILRPPLVYGPEVKGNFLSLIRWVSKGLPLPLGSVHNQRSLVALDNLVDLIITCIEHTAAANQTFLVADGEDLSTEELIQRMGKAFGKKPRLLPCPVSLLNAAASLVGKKKVAQRLLGSLQVDVSKTRNQLGWTQPITVDEGLKRVAEYFINY